MNASGNKDNFRRHFELTYTPAAVDSSRGLSHNLMPLLSYQLPGAVTNVQYRSMHLGPWILYN